MQQSRITINTNVNSGKPSIRNMRFSVSNMLDLLASGMNNEEILADYPFLEIEDIYACLEFASKHFNSREVSQLAPIS